MRTIKRLFKVGLFIERLSVSKDRITFGFPSSCEL